MSIQWVKERKQAFDPQETPDTVSYCCFPVNRRTLSPVPLSGRTFFVADNDLCYETKVRMRERNKC